jgi:ABC-type glycerol-3-phosphate transport system permease component
MLSCIYWGALFGGAITSILFNIPGEPWSVATTFDGYPMAQQGRAAQALTAAFTSSFVGALFAVVLITFLAPLLAKSSTATAFRSRGFLQATVLSRISIGFNRVLNPIKILLKPYQIKGKSELYKVNIDKIKELTKECAYIIKISNNVKYDNEKEVTEKNKEI